MCKMGFLQLPQMSLLATLHLTTTLYGRISADPASLSHIRARFDGVIKDVKVNIGDSQLKKEIF